MKFSRRCFCVLLCCLLLSGVFSIVASAEEVTLTDLKVSAWADIAFSDGDYFETPTYTFNPNNGTKQSWVVDYDIYDVGGKHTLTYHWTFSQLSGAPLLKKSKYESTITLSAAYFSLYAVGSYSSVYYRTPSSVKALVFYNDGGSQYFDITSFYNSGADMNLNFDFVPTADVTKIEFIVTQEFQHYFPEDNGRVEVFLGETGGDGSWVLSVDQATKSEGLLSGILDKVTDTVENLKNGFKETVDNLKNGFKNVVDGITDLPEKLWEKISQGILDLFVPDEDYLVEYKDRMDEFLAEKFGAIYQVVQVTFESWERITDADEQNIIQFPETTIQITNDTSFSFGPYEVPIVPTGFEWLTTILKTVCGIVCTILFVNGLRKRYDEVMGVEK